MDDTPPSETPDAEGGEALERARFPERLVAFCVDLLAVLASWFLLAALLHAVGLAPESSAFWLVLFLFVFVAYHAALNAGGRRPLGKMLLGLRVYTSDGYPPSFAVSLGRAAGYLLSNILCLGYLWALIQPEGLAWHDMLAGTMVLRTHPKSRLERAVIALAAFCCVLVYAGSAAWIVAAPYYWNMRRVANAKDGILALSQFEETYKKHTGAYTGDISTLSQVYGNQQDLFDLLGKNLDISTLSLQSDGTHYEIRADALDSKRTPLYFKGPPPSEPGP